MVRIYKIQFDSWVQQCGCNFFTNFACCFLRACYFSPCGRGVKYAYRLPACCMRGLKRCPDGSASTACDYAGLLCNLYRDASLKRCPQIPPYSPSLRARVLGAIIIIIRWCQWPELFRLRPLLSVPSTYSTVNFCNRNIDLEESCCFNIDPSQVQ